MFNILQNAKYYDQINELKRIESIIITIMRSIGLVGSIFMFAVYSQPSLSRLSVGIYFRYMAMICAIQSVLNFIIDHFKDQLALGPFYLLSSLCYLSYLSVPISTWLDVLASLDRFIVILFPHKYKFVQKANSQRLAIVTIFIINMIVYSHILLGNDLISKIFDINEKERYGYLKLSYIISLIDLVNSSAVPFAFMLGTSIATFVGILRVHRRLKSSFSTSNGSFQRKLLRDIKFGVTMIVLDVLFFVFIFAYRLHRVVKLNPFDYQNQKLAHHIFLVFINDLNEFYYFANFYIQLAVNSLVRKELTNVFIQLGQSIRKFMCVIYRSILKLN